MYLITNQYTEQERNYVDPKPGSLYYAEIGHGKLFDCGFKFMFRLVLSIIIFFTVAICGLTGRTKQELHPLNFYKII